MRCPPTSVLHSYGVFLPLGALHEQIRPDRQARTPQRSPRANLDIAQEGIALAITDARPTEAARGGLRDLDDTTPAPAHSGHLQ